MAKVDAKSILEEELPGAVVDTTSFGRGTEPCLWIAEKKFRKACEILSEHDVLGLDWLENFSVAQIEDALLLTYFLRSTRTNQRLLLRKTLSIPKDKGAAQAISVADLWPTARRFEKEAAWSFGIEFVGAKTSLGREEKKFPLRKDFEFPEDMA